MGRGVEGDYTQVAIGPVYASLGTKEERGKRYIERLDSSLTVYIIMVFMHS